MKKMNNKGFLMVEALIVSTFVVSVLIYFFVQFKKVDESFELSYSYNTVNGLYAVNNISMYLDSLYGNNFEEEINLIKTTAPYYKVIYNGNTTDSSYLTCDTYCTNLMTSLNVKKAILASGNLNDLITNTDDDSFFSEKMRDFIKRERSKKLYSSDYKILVQFNDNTFASLDKLFEDAYNKPKILVTNVTSSSTSITISYSLTNVHGNVQVGCMYGTNSTNLSSDNNVIIDTTNSTCTISGLMSDTTYYYSLNISSNNILLFETNIQSIRVNSPTTIAAHDVVRGTTSITIPYTLTNVHGDVQVGCMYGTNSTNLSSDNNVVIDTTNNICTISGLTRGTQYYYSLSVQYDNDINQLNPVSITTKYYGGKYVAKTQTDTHQGIVYMDPTDLSRECNQNIYDATNNVNGYNRTIETKSGYCMRWYIYSKDNTNTKMILDHNTTARIEFSSTSANAATMLTEINKRLENDTSDWQIDQNNIKVIEGSEIATITGKEGWAGASTDYFYFDGLGKSKSKTYTESSRNPYAWLFNNTYQCANASGTDYGCTEEDTSASYYSYKLNNNKWTSSTTRAKSDAYWTGTKNSSHVWFISRNGNMNHNGASIATYGIRPVVTIPSVWLEES